LIKLSVIVVNWNTRELLAKSLASIYNTIVGFEYEVFVVDNGSTDGSLEMVREKFPKVRLVENQENLGFAKANNQAIHLSQGEYLLLLNSDAALQKDAAAELLQTAQAHPEVGILGPGLKFPDGSPQRSFGPLPTLMSEILSLAGFDKRWRNEKSAQSNPQVIETGYVDGACQLIRRGMVDQVGLFDENFFFFSEEIDLCQRAHLAGWRVLHVPQSEVIHVGGGSTVSSAKRILMLYRGKLLYFKKHHGLSACNYLLTAMQITSWVKSKAYRFPGRKSKKHDNREAIWQTVSTGLHNIEI
jgi:GT2 family glycosyltransferase